MFYVLTRVQHWLQYSKVSNIALMFNVALSRPMKLCSNQGSSIFCVPEYAYRMRVDEKGDIYSFGVVLLELVTGRPAIDAAVFGEGVDLVSWVSTKVQTKEGLYEILDADCGKNVQDEMIMLLRVGLLCTSFMPMSRPSMREVVMMLKIAEPKSIRDAKAKVGDEKAKVGGDDKVEGNFLDKVEVSVQK